MMHELIATLFPAIALLLIYDLYRFVRDRI